jgi:septation ring formation regulator EzrA
MDKFLEYAPLLLVVFMFFIQHKVFVTPAQMTKEFMDFETHLENKYVQKETYNIAIDEMKQDIAEIKEKIDRMYDKLMAV